MSAFQLQSNYTPTGDQPEAIKKLVEGVNANTESQVLLGVTGSGKTFTIANVIQQTQRPTLILSHNKTLASQLYSEFKAFFPNNKVEYFVSYYDYYQPEAFIPTTNTYIEKDLAINDELEQMRISTTSTLMSDRRDVIVVSSVSCIYGMGNPDDFYANVITIKVGQIISRNAFLHKLVQALYSRTEAEFKRGNFRVKGDTVDVYLVADGHAYRIYFFGDEIEAIEMFDPNTGRKLEDMEGAVINPASLFMTTKETMQAAIIQIQDDMMKQVEYFNENGKPLEAKRLEDRVTYDLEMMRELGYCSGVENYSRYFDGRKTGARPFCLLDYFPKDFLMVIDESHVSVSQIGAMYGGDRSRKINLVDYGFRLPSALDNRPLKFEEFRSMLQQTIYVSATPADYELTQTGGEIVEQIIRPTGLLDPIIEVRPSANQVDDLLHEIELRAKADERVLVTTLTKRMAEELCKYLLKMDVRCRYVHSEVDTLERVQILAELRKGLFDVLIGVNLLREGLDLPEVSLVAILDADKEGFLRNNRSLTQTVGRAARNVNGRVIFYADKMTKSMNACITETEYRRQKQIQYNTDHNMVPTPLHKPLPVLTQVEISNLNDETTLSSLPKTAKVKPYYETAENMVSAAESSFEYMTKDQLTKKINLTRRAMEKAAKELDFIGAAQLRDQLKSYQNDMEVNYKM
jgi:excinuclease ABC subunit B